jgi:cell division protein FtsI/penicillin-binding protein 2
MKCLRLDKGIVFNERFIHVFLFFITVIILLFFIILYLFVIISLQSLEKISKNKNKIND